MSKRTPIDYEKFMAGLRMGMTQNGACRYAGCSNPGIQYRKRRDKKFKDQVDRLLAKRHMATGGKHVKATKEDLARVVIVDEEVSEVSGDPRYGVYLDRLVENEGNRVAAAQESGLKIAEIQQALDPNSQFFNPDFADRVRELELKRLLAVEDAAFDRALVDNDASQQRFLLQKRHPAYKGKDKPSGPTIFFLDTRARESVMSRLDELVSEEFRGLLTS